MNRDDCLDSRLALLHTVSPGDTVSIVRLQNTDDMKRRLTDLGFIKGTSVKCVLKTRNGAFAAYLVRDTVIALRKEDAADILVEMLW